MKNMNLLLFSLSTLLPASSLIKSQPANITDDFALITEAETKVTLPSNLWWTSPEEDMIAIYPYFPDLGLFEVNFDQISKVEIIVVNHGSYKSVRIKILEKDVTNTDTSVENFWRRTKITPDENCFVANLSDAMVAGLENLLGYELTETHEVNLNNISASVSFTLNPSYQWFEIAHISFNN